MLDWVFVMSYDAGDLSPGSTGYNVKVGRRRRWRAAVQPSLPAGSVAARLLAAPPATPLACPPPLRLGPLPHAALRSSALCVLRCVCHAAFAQEALAAYCYYVKPCSRVLMGVQVPPEAWGGEWPCAAGLPCVACWRPAAVSWFAALPPPLLCRRGGDGAQNRGAGAGGAAVGRGRAHDVGRHEGGHAQPTAAGAGGLPRARHRRLRRAAAAGGGLNTPLCIEHSSSCIANNCIDPGQS